MSYFTLSVSMCAGVSGSAPRQECVAPPTAVALHVREQPPEDTRDGMYVFVHSMCVFACVCVCV